MRAWLVAFGLFAVASVLASFGYYFRTGEGVVAWVASLVCGAVVIGLVLRREAHRRSRRASDASRSAMGLLTWSYKGRRHIEPFQPDSGRRLLVASARVVLFVLAGIGWITGAQHCPGYQNEGYIWTIGSLALLVGGWLVSAWWVRRDPEPAPRAVRRAMGMAGGDDVSLTAAGLVLGYRARAWSGTACRLVRVGLITQPVDALELEFVHWRLFHETLALPLPREIWADARSIVAMLEERIQGRQFDPARIREVAPGPDQR